MTFESEPTPNQVKRYVQHHFERSKADAILERLNKVNETCCGRRGWYQGAIFIHWRDACNGRIDLIDQYVKMVNNDHRDFLATFDQLKHAGWENAFIHDDES